MSGSAQCERPLLPPEHAAPEKEQLLPHSEPAFDLQLAFVPSNSSKCSSAFDDRKDAVATWMAGPYKEAFAEVHARMGHGMFGTIRVVEEVSLKFMTMLGTLMVRGRNGVSTYAPLSNLCDELFAAFKTKAPSPEIEAMLEKVSAKIDSFESLKKQPAIKQQLQAGLDRLREIAGRQATE